ncbi:hypothetical protein PanWU01x14_280880 [Parasponia andersonii]|uniref:Uncharacterized protein n=1 Tax=Parasponia andersonii TaxID=3476 RepID=A0A2P5B163_PARAD|nr:hypothetical protein PanWU01x14_280880 [Parasponia andersonii]
MTGKPPEGTRGSGQPRVLRAVGARTVVVLLGVAEIVLMEDILFVASSVTRRKSVLLACRNLLFLNRRGARPQQSQGASQAFTSPQPYQHQYLSQGYTQNFQTPQASGSQGGRGFGSSGPGSNSSRPGQGRGNKGKGKYFENEGIAYLSNIVISPSLLQTIQQSQWQERELRTTWN